MSKHKRPSIRRTAEQTLNPEQLRVWCEDCWKWSYAARDHATDEKRRIKRHDPSIIPLETYRCHIDSRRWHVGHSRPRGEDIRRYYLGHAVAMGDK